MNQAENGERRMDKAIMFWLAIIVLLMMGSVALLGEGQMYFGAILLGVAIFVVWRLSVGYFMRREQEHLREMGKIY